jgi:hypothetical protein
MVDAIAICLVCDAEHKPSIACRDCRVPHINTSRSTCAGPAASSAVGCRHRSLAGNRCQVSCQFSARSVLGAEDDLKPLLPESHPPFGRTIVSPSNEMTGSPSAPLAAT